MVSSTTPKLAPRWPCFVDTISIIKSRSSLANCGNCSRFNFLKSDGFDMLSNKFFMSSKKNTIYICVLKADY